MASNYEYRPVDNAVEREIFRLGTLVCGSVVGAVATLIANKAMTYSGDMRLAGLLLAAAPAAMAVFSFGVVLREDFTANGKAMTERQPAPISPNGPSVDMSNSPTLAP